MATVKMSCAKDVKIPSENLKHPERRKNEVFLCNVSGWQATGYLGRFIRYSLLFSISITEEEENTMTLNRNFRNLEYGSKRLGEISYDTNGNPMKGYKPVFVSKQEYKEKMANQTM